MANGEKQHSGILGHDRLRVVDDVCVCTWTESGSGPSMPATTGGRRSTICLGDLFHRALVELVQNEYRAPVDVDEVERPHHEVRVLEALDQRVCGGRGGRRLGFDAEKLHAVTCGSSPIGRAAAANAKSQGRIGRDAS
jgi:hypothetical protein